MGKDNSREYLIKVSENYYGHCNEYGQDYQRENPRVYYIKGELVMEVNI